MELVALEDRRAGDQRTEDCGTVGPSAVQCTREGVELRFGKVSGGFRVY